VDNILNGEAISRSHAFGITENHFTTLGFATLIGQPEEVYRVVYFPNPKQGWFDRFWNGTSYIFMTRGYIEHEIGADAPNPSIP
jgi:hypothetical protein